MVLTKIIFEYLQNNRRITVPALGTFLSKGNGSPLLFSEFMKGDDGVLRETLCSQAGVSELEAAIVIDRFVFELRHAMECSERYTMPYLGYMSSEDGRTYSFQYDPSAGQSEEQPIAETTQEEQRDRVTAPIIESEEQEVIVETEPVTTELPPVEQKPQIEAIAQPTTTGVKRRRTDIWLIVGIIALCFAILAILYGVIVEWSVGNVSFGEPIDSYLEYFVDGGFWESVHGAISPDVELAPNTEEIIPRDTIYI